MTPRTAAILCYIPVVGWIAAVVVLATDQFRRNRTLRFHAFQGLYLFVAWLIVSEVIGPGSASVRAYFRTGEDPARADSVHVDLHDHQGQPG